MYGPVAITLHSLQLLKFAFNAIQKTTEEQNIYKTAYI